MARRAECSGKVSCHGYLQSARSLVVCNLSELRIILTGKLMWHMNAVYKRSDQPIWAGDDINLTRGFIEAEADPLRRRLMGARGWEAKWLEEMPRSSETDRAARL